MHTTTEKPTAKTFVLENYDGRKFRKEIELCVSKLAREDFDPKQSQTFDLAADEVARPYGMDRGELSWIAHRTDFMKKRAVSVLQFLRQAKDSIARPCLPGFELEVRLPQQLLIDDEVVDLGDSRLTLQELIDQLTLGEGMVEKEAEAMNARWKELNDEAAAFRAMRENCKAVAKKAWELYQVMASGLIYDKQEKIWTPRPGA